MSYQETRVQLFHGAILYNGKKNPSYCFIDELLNSILAQIDTRL